MWIAKNWQDFELLDCTDGERLERWGDKIVIRPDPQVIWDGERRHPAWKASHGRYLRSKTGGGAWEKGKLPEKWQISYGDLNFQVGPMNFKHMGVFPEQAANWEYIQEKVRTAGRPLQVLNLFAYTGGASIAALSAGAHVCHVDAARGMVSWARENARISGLEEAPCRWIVDDCVKFVEREIRRGRRYDAIILDPPSYGRGPDGEVWKLEEALYPFLCLVRDVLSDKPSFVLLNSYTTGLSASTITYMCQQVFGTKFGGETTSRELGLPVTQSGLVLPCGASARWEMK